MGTRHMGITKAAVIQGIQSWGAKAVLPEWDGTDADAIAAVEADPREVLCPCSCIKNPDGSCSGRTPTPASMRIRLNEDPANERGDECL